jgi:hypothetical protein
LRTFREHKVEPGLGEEAVDEAGTVLHPYEPTSRSQRVYRHADWALGPLVGFGGPVHHRGKVRLAAGPKMWRSARAEPAQPPRGIVRVRA